MDRNEIRREVLTVLSELLEATVINVPEQSDDGDEFNNYVIDIGEARAFIRSKLQETAT